MKKEYFFTGLALAVIAGIIIPNIPKPDVTTLPEPGPFKTYGLTARVEGNRIIITSINYREYDNTEYGRIRRMIDAGYAEAPESAPEPVCNIRMEQPQPPLTTFQYMVNAPLYGPFLNAEPFH